MDACISRALAVVAGAVLSLSGGACSAPAGELTRLTTERLGNVFAPDEPIRFTATGPSGPWRWVVSDWQGARHTAGQLDVIGGEATLLLPSSTLGYFELEAGPASCTPECAGRASFAIIPHPQRLSAVFGVMTHVAHGWETDFAPLVARAGIGNIRDEQYWAKLERASGTFTFPQVWANYVDQLEALGIRPLLVMNWGNKLYDDGKTPNSAEALEAYGRYGVALTQRFPAQVRALEVWNEINGKWCDGECPKDRPGTYAGLLGAAWNALKVAAPGVTVVGGATAGIPLPFWRELASRGVFDHLDAVSVHRYGKEPESPEQEIEALRSLMREHGAGEKPIWVTETGNGGKSPESRRAAAAWLVKRMTVLRSADVARIYWYLMRDYQGFDGLGLVRAPDSSYGRYAPNPAYVAYATLLKVVGDAPAVRREALPDARTRVYLFDRSGTQVRVAWSAEGDSTLTLAAEQPLTLIDIMGQARPLTPRDGRVTARLDSTPLFLLGPARLLHDRRADQLLADSRADFGTSADGGPWRYGYAVLAPGVNYDAQRDFHVLQLQQNAFGEFWGNPRWRHLAITASNMHPKAANGRQIAVIRRWLAPQAATVAISGQLSIARSRGDGTRAMVVVDGREIATWSLAPGTSKPYTLTTSVRAGSIVDLVVTPGLELDDRWDTTGFTATILMPVAAEAN